MTLQITHNKVATTPDDPAFEVGQTEWNDTHKLSMAPGMVLGRGSAGAGTIEEITLGTNLSLSGTTLNATGGAPGGSSGQVQYNNAGNFGGFTISGDATLVTSTGVMTIANAAVTYAKMQNVSVTSRFIGRISAGAGSPEELTGTQATTLLDTFTTALKGLAPASGGGTTNFLRADGTWSVPAGGGNVSNSGTPTAGQLATWVTATTIQGVTALPAANEPAHTGDVTNTAGSLAMTIANQAVTYAKMQNVSATSRFLGRITAGAGSPEELTAANAWTILGVQPAANEPAHTGDVTNTAGSLALTIGNATVTYAKMQNISGASLLLGRGSAAGAGSPQEITLGTNLSMSGTTLNATGGGGTPGGSSGQLQYNNAGAFGGANVWRTSANQLDLANSANAQSFYVYNTTDVNGGTPTNYERGVFDWTTTANTLTIGESHGGTGQTRNVTLNSGAYQLIGGNAVSNEINIGSSTNAVIKFMLSAAFANDARLAFANNLVRANSNMSFCWASAVDAYNNGADVGMSRVTTKVMAIGDGGLNANGWVQWTGQRRVTADVNSNNTTTLAIATGLGPVALQAGRTYSFDVYLSFTCTAAQGIRAAMVATGGLTATNIIYDGWIIDSGANGIKGNTNATALGGVVANAPLTGTSGVVQIKGTITVNVAGSIEVDFAQSVAAANNTTVKRGSYMIIHDIP